MPAAFATVLQIIPRLDTGGAELSTIEVTEAIVKAGGRALVASEGGRMAGEIARLGGELVAFPAATKNPLRILANARRLARLIEAEKVDIVHARSRAPAWSALIAARRTGRPFVTTYHGAYGGRGALKTWYNGVMARGDLVIANSAYTARLIAERHGTPETRIRVIHRGVDVARFDRAAIAPERISALREEWGLAPGDRVVLQAARLTGWKGQRVLIEAARLLASSGRLGDAVVVMAGDAQGRDGYREELLARIEAAGLGTLVRLVGHCADMPAAFALADLAVIASTEPEAFGRATAEALAVGCPVVATDLGAPPETLLVKGRVPEGSHVGWLAEPGDAAGLAARIAEALALSQSERAALADRALAHVRAHFTVAQLQGATLDVYRELLAGMGENPAGERGRPAPRA
ncbi:MAG: glycosyltransferase family 4 protein [Hyphomicrobiaceae bacterium]